MDYLRQHFSDSLAGALVWLFPLTYALHIAEEYFADFPGYLRQTQGLELSESRFVVLQSFGFLLMTVGVLLSRRLHFPNQMFAILATVLLGNSIIHVVRTFLLHTYEPGLITCLLLWVPLGTYTLILQWGRFSGRRYFLCVTIGIAICIVVEILPLANDIRKYGT